MRIAMSLMILYFILVFLLKVNAKSATHSVLCGSSSFVISRRMGVEGYDSFTPIELNGHESVYVCIVLGSGQIVVSFNMSISSGLNSREEIMHFAGSIIVSISESLNVSKPLDIGTVIFKPNCSVESHLVVLY